MALDTQIQIVTNRLVPASVQITWKIQCQSVRIDYDRSPISAPLPGNVNPLLLDLGQYRVNIQIEGVTSETGTNINDGGTPIMDKNNLESAVQDWWNEDVRFTVSDDIYTVKVQGASFSLAAALENRWTFRLQLTGYKGTGSPGGSPDYTDGWEIS